jgi:2-dehydro-3-deoxyphosphogluconate aldolase/(4S)-4-hydroxy-2-oxoglutarate aldolase
VKKEEVLAKIHEVGIVPGIRTSSAEDGRFAAEAIAEGGIPIVEITMTVPKAIDVISDMVKQSPHLIVGAGTVLDLETARRCLDAGVGFITSPGLNLKIVEFAVKEDRLVIAGAMTPTEVIAAWQAGSQLVKVFPCGPIGGSRLEGSTKKQPPTSFWQGPQLWGSVDDSYRKLLLNIDAPNK